MTHPDGGYFTYDYDGMNRATAIRENGATLVAMLGYDDLGRRATLARGGGVATTSYGYDGASRLSCLTHDLAGGGAPACAGNVAGGSDYLAGFVSSPAGQIVSRTVANDAYAYTEAYNVARGYAANGLNQYTQIASFATLNPTYDANGNLTSDGGTTFTYDSENRLTGASGAKSASLAYDPLGRLFETGGGSAGTTRFLYDGDALVAEYDGAGTLLKRYVHGPGVDEPLVWYEGNAVSAMSRRYLYADHQGSIVAVSDADGTLIKANSYDPYGIASANALGRFRYTGQIVLPEIGLYHYKARAYSPTLGRFLQTDPAGYDDQINLYALRPKRSGQWA